MVNGVPSVGVPVMCGSGQIGTQQTLDVASLPSTSLPSGSNGNSTTTSTTNGKSGAQAAVVSTWSVSLALLAALGLASILEWR